MKTWIIRLACVALFIVAAPEQQTRAEGIFSDGGPDAGTPEYYQYHANSPVGSRQRYHKGKLWPPKPRPTGPHQPFCHKYHAATYWPWPYVCQDRAVVRGAWQSQIDNGWITATTMYDFHFDTETGELNTSGRRQLQYILTHVPQEYQKLYVSSTFEPRVSQARTMSIQTELANMGVGQQMPIQLRATHPLTRSAEVVEGIDRAFTENLPPPVITYQGIASGGGGGGGGGN